MEPKPLQISTECGYELFYECPHCSSVVRDYELHERMQHTFETIKRLWLSRKKDSDAK